MEPDQVHVQSSGHHDEDRYHEHDDQVDELDDDND